jgi:hypothetical protein
MSLSDIIASVTGEQASATVSIQDSAYHVKIGDSVELGIRDFTDPDTGRPNPGEIRYTQEFEIVIHKTVGQKPLTQCTIPVGLWETVADACSPVTDAMISDKDMINSWKNIYGNRRRNGLL